MLLDVQEQCSQVIANEDMKTSWALGLRGSDWAAPFLALERMYSDQDPSYEVTV